MIERRRWSDSEIAQVQFLWPHKTSVQIGAAIGRSAASVRRMADRLHLPEKNREVFCKKIMNAVVYFKLPISKGLKKLLDRSDTLLKWVEEGRDNYELSRAFHVPMADIETVVRRLGLVRPYETEAEPEVTIMRSCAACREPFQATRYRFRCDPCLGTHARHDDTEYTLGAIR